MLFLQVAKSCKPLRSALILHFLYKERIISLLYPPDWFKANPDYQNYQPIPEESVSPQSTSGTVRSDSVLEGYMRKSFKNHST